MIYYTYICTIQQNKDIMSKKLTIEEFIIKANEKHKYFYNYSKSVYVNNNTKLIITCPIHDDFKQSPNSHLTGSGCPKCYGKIRLTTEEFVIKANEIHNNFYNYDKSVYKANKTKLIITCPIHNDFEQTPNNHLKGQACPKCSGKYRPTTEEFIEKANEVHNNFYNYDKSIYKGAKTKLIITCPIHNDFEQSPTSHLSGQGCPKCGIMKFINKKTLTTEEFVIKANEIHNNFYNYYKSVYINNNTKLTITCPIHNDFEQKPNSHLNGRGCSKCANEIKSRVELKLYDYINNHYECINSYMNKEILGRQHIDIFIPEYNIAIEYQGRQHFKIISIFGGEKEFKEIQKRDQRKYELCNKYGIKLFYFSYDLSYVPDDYSYKVYSDEQELLDVINMYIDERQTA